MDLENLSKNFKNTVTLLINNEGEIIDYYPDVIEYHDIEDKISVFSRVLMNMSIDFFSNFFDSKIQELTVKSDGKYMFLYNLGDGTILCFISEAIINSAIIALTLKKQNFI